ncbi:Hypothetical predicted protein [Scomber scombrus]|uniref:Uncharacterized protein n=1 Tax=Scomber scombrus TaxID=13677 RepID=A0AAV1PDJ2_SCOSC
MDHGSSSSKLLKEPKLTGLQVSDRLSTRHMMPSEYFHPWMCYIVGANLNNNHSGGAVLPMTFLPATGFLKSLTSASRNVPDHKSDDNKHRGLAPHLRVHTRPPGGGGADAGKVWSLVNTGWRKGDYPVWLLRGSEATRVIKEKPEIPHPEKGSHTC